MSVKLRLTRLGKRKQPTYRIVATDSHQKRDGEYIEQIGTYNPLTSPASIKIDEEIALKWLNNGAIPSDTVKNLLHEVGIMKKFADSKTKKTEKKEKKEKVEKVEKTEKAPKKTVKTEKTTKKAKKAE